MESRTPRLETSAVFKSILVAARNTEADHTALARAKLCASPGATVTLLDVVYEPALEGYLGNKEIYEPLRSRVVRERRQRVEKLAETLTADGVAAAGSAVWDHPLEEAIAKEARRVRADLVVATPLPSHRGGLAHSDWRLVTTCPVPVLIARSSAAHTYQRIVAALDPYHAHAKPAELDAAILASAKAMQAVTGATLTAVYCYLPINYFGADVGVQWSGFEHRRLEALHELLDAANLPRTAARLVEGLPHAVLERMLDGGEADLIVMGGLARGRLKELVIGSTAERVLHRAHGDVLVVKPAAATSQ
jgi:universal stress protein E